MENEKGSVTESKVKSSLLKRSSYQESFEDMLSGMDEKLKEFCAKKQKTNVRKPKKRGKTNTSSKTQDKDRGMVSPEAQQDLMVGGDGEMTDKRAENKTLEEDEASVNPDDQRDLMDGDDGVMTDKRAERKTPEEDERSETTVFNIHVRLERQEQVPSLDLRPREEQEHCLDSEEGQPLPEKYYFNSDAGVNLETEDASVQAESKKPEEGGVEDASETLSDGQGVNNAKRTRKKRAHKENYVVHSETNPKKIKVEQVEQESDWKGKRRIPQRERNKSASETDMRKSKTDKEEQQQKSQAKEEEKEENKWKWWEEEHYEDGVKWRFLEHKGPLFAPEYEPLTDNVRFHYNGQPMKLSANAEEVATFFGKMLDHEYTTNAIFRANFFTDWREVMTSAERKLITNLNKCDFQEIHTYFTEKTEAKRVQSKEVKQDLKMEQEAIAQEYGYCTMDGHRERIANYKIEPPGLFRGRGSHPKMGKLKNRIQPEDVIINCSRDSKIPVPPTGHNWKEVRFDNKVTWLASWTENVQGAMKYIMLNPSSKLKGEKDWQKFEIARRLKGCVDDIRAKYSADLKSREMKSRQRAVALYFIDKLALRAGNEKEEGETADTVGCCSLRVEHIKLHNKLNGQACVVEFDFLGKDSIRYYNKVLVKKQVFKNLKHFMQNKDPSDDVFDRLNTHNLNKHLQELMEGLTAKVFRTYNASITLQHQLEQLTDSEGSEAEKLLSYNRANRAVAVLCNHQRTAPKSFDQSMKKIQAKIEAKKEQIDLTKSELKSAKMYHKVKKDKKSKLCKKYDVPIEKVYNKTQREKFAWAIDMTEEDFVF
ncbi:DNA topoisomerase I, mitochondrial isoform X4 [Callorhinchus milii]|uniref:DNA topoisomerase I, mitochondrial isoform X4 n=1 Tax=Callorhinchus milii TaxID=7868 RepID=UPI001C3F8710|nr:DNA topoisomerase I, mitochondrial isoform X4 [Callorhinchus milii]